MDKQSIDYLLSEEIDSHGEVVNKYKTTNGFNLNVSDPIKHIIFKPINSIKEYQVYIYPENIIYIPELQRVYILNKIDILSFLDTVKTTYAGHYKELYSNLNLA